MSPAPYSNKLLLCQSQRHRGSRRSSSNPFSSRHRRRWVETNTPPVALPPGKRPDIYCTGGWVHPRTGLDSTVAPTAIRCPAVQPVTSRYTNYAVFGRGLNGYGHLKHLCLSLFLSVVTLRARECKPYYSNSFFNILRIIVIHGDFQQGILFL